MGYVGWIGNFQGKTGTGKERNYESQIVTELRNMGATLYCKTSVPHTLMCGETVNNIIGYTWNPKNRNLSSGGSSGGEGALIGLRGSCAGFGTDIGMHLATHPPQQNHSKTTNNAHKAAQSASQQLSMASTASALPSVASHTKAWPTASTAKAACSQSSALSPPPPTLSNSSHKPS